MASGIGSESPTTRPERIQKQAARRFVDWRARRARDSVVAAAVVVFGRFVLGCSARVLTLTKRNMS